MRKTRSFMTLEGWRDLVSDSMSIDMGSANTIIAVRGRGVVVDEPSVVAVNRISGETVALGREAYEMQGRESREIQLVAPMGGGVVADFERTQQMLHYFVRKARSGVSHFSRRAIMSVLSGVTQVEQRALMSAAEHARLARVYMVEEGLAAAIGAGVSIEDLQASAVVDIGGDSTNIAVVARGMIIYARAERIGSGHIDEAIAERLRRHHGLLIGPLTAERLKVQLGSALEPEDPSRSITVKGRDVQEGTPRAVEINSEEVCLATAPVVSRLSRVVQRALGELSPEVAADIYDRGIILTGGGALLDNLAPFLQRETRLATTIANEPRHAAVRGLQQLFEEPLLLRRVTRNEQSAMLDAQQAGAFDA